MNTKLAAIVMLVLAAVIAVSFFFLSGRTEPFRLLGEILVPAAVFSGIFWISRGRLPFLNCIAISLLVAVILTAIRNYDEVRFRYETRQAEQALKAASDTTKIGELARQYPNNRILKTMNISWLLGAATRGQINGLLEHATAQIASFTKPLFKLAPDEVTAARQALGLALERLSSLKDKVPELCAAQYASAIKEMEKIDNPKMTDAALNGVRNQMLSDIDYFQRLISAYEEFYGDLAKQADYLKASGGQFDASSQKVLFKDQAGADGWNAILAKTQNSRQKLQAFNAEAAKLNQLQGDLYKIFQ